MSDRQQRKVRVGLVVGDSMNKTVVVDVEQTMKHRLYGKIYKRNTKLKAHDEANEARTGDRVRVMETKPLSKTKRWRVTEILERAK